jgi:hypothetical protein
MPGWKVWVTGGVVLFAIGIIGYLDWTSKHPGTYDRGMPLPIRVLCFLCGLVMAVFGVFGILFTGGLSLIFVILSVFLFAAAFIKMGNKSSVPPAQAQQPFERIQPVINQPPTIEGLDENNELSSLGNVFVNLLHKTAFRIPFMLLCFGLFMWGAFLLAVNPSLLEKYGLIVILILAVGYVGLRVISLKRLIKTINKTQARK